MKARAVLYVLLVIVAVASAVLSFSALRDLALLCGFTPALAPLLPIVVDAGAAAGSLVWLGGAVPDQARRFARSLAVALLVLSVAANALGHALAAFALAPAWWVVVIVSAVAPAVLGAVVHLAVLVGRPVDHPAGPAANRTSSAAERVELAPTPAPDPGHLDRAGAGAALVDVKGSHEVGALPRFATSGSVQVGHLDAADKVDSRGVESNDSTVDDQAPTGGSTAVDHGDDRRSTPVVDPVELAKLAAAGAGRRRAAKVLGVSPYKAEQLLAQARTAPPQPPVEARSAAVEGDRLAVNGKAVPR